MIVPTRKITARIVGIGARHVDIAITDPFSGHKRRYTLWRLRLGAGGDGFVGEAAVHGRGIPLALCRRLSKERSNDA